LCCQVDGVSARTDKKAQSRVTRQAGKRTGARTTAAAVPSPRPPKTAAPDSITSSIVHDCNNLLMVVILNLELLDDSVSPADRDFLVRPALRAARMSACLMQDLLAGAGGRHPKRATPGAAKPPTRSNRLKVRMRRRRPAGRSGAVSVR
jgi:hypothetical protein